MDRSDEGRDFLAHHGILGMHWGVRKPESNVREGRSTLIPVISEHEKAVQNKVGADEFTSEKYRQMYGPNSDSGLSPGEKKALLGVGIGAGALIGAALLAKYGNKAYSQKLVALGLKDLLSAESGIAKKGTLNAWRESPSQVAAQRAEMSAFFKKEFGNVQKSDGGIDFNKLEKQIQEHTPPKTSFQTFLEEQSRTKLNNTVGGYTKEVFDKLGSEEVTLKSGSVIKRISTEKESTVNPLGFFAAHSEEDISRYKAVLPTYWKQWGYDAKEGYIVSLKATSDIKVQAPQDTVNTLKSLLDEPLTYKYQTVTKNYKVKVIDKTARVRDFLEDAYPSQTKYSDATNDEELIRSVFPTLVKVG